MEHQCALHLYVCTHVCPQIGQLAEVLDCDGLLDLLRGAAQGAPNVMARTTRHLCCSSNRALTPPCTHTQASKASAPHTVRNRCRWSDEEDVRLVRLVMDKNYRFGECDPVLLQLTVNPQVCSPSCATAHS